MAMTRKERLIADCKYFGTFCGRWHTNEFWADLLERSAGMSEQECDAAIKQYEAEADALLLQWKTLYQ